MTEISKLPVTEAMRLCRDTTTIETIIELTKHSHPQVRQRALKVSSLIYNLVSFFIYLKLNAQFL